MSKNHSNVTQGIEHLPQVFASELQRLLTDNSLETDIYEHICYIDLFARYIFFIPLAYYFHLLRTNKTTKFRGDQSLNNAILDAIGVRKGRSGSGGLTPYAAIELSGRVVDVLTKANHRDGLVDDLAQVHRHFSVYEANGKRRGLSPDANRLFKQQRDNVCHAHALISSEAKRVVCDEYRRYFLEWCNDKFFSMISLAAMTATGERRSVMGATTDWQGADFRDGSEYFVYNSHGPGTSGAIEFSASPFIRLSFNDRRARMLVLNAYEESPTGQGVAKYTDCELRPSGNGMIPHLGRATFDTTIYFPWLRLSCERTITTDKVPVKHSINIHLNFSNIGSEVAIVDAFRELLPSPLHTVTGDLTVDHPRLEIAPGDSLGLSYVVTADEIAEQGVDFGLRDISVSQGNLTGRVPVRGSLRLAVVPTLPPNISIQRTVTRCDEGAWIQIATGDRVQVGEEVRVTVSIVNTGGDLDCLKYVESLSRRTCRRFLNYKLSGHPKASPLELAQNNERRPTLSLNLPRPFSASAELRLDYSFYAEKAGRITLRNDHCEGSVGLEIFRTFAPAPFGLRVRGSEAPTLVVSVASSRPDHEPGKQTSLRLGLVVRNTARQLALQPQLIIHVASDHSVDILTVPCCDNLAGHTQIAVAVDIPVPNDRWPEFSVDVAYVTITGQARVEKNVLRQRDLKRAWKSPRDVVGFLGRAEVTKELRGALFALDGKRPVFLTGASGVGKVRLLKSLAEPSVCGPSMMLFVERPVPLLGAASNHVSQFVQLAKALCLRAAPLEDASNDGEEERLAAGLDAMGVRLDGFDAHVREFVDYGSQRRTDATIADDLLRLLHIFFSFRKRALDNTLSETEKRFALVLPITVGSNLGREGARLFAEICERLQRNNPYLRMVVVDTYCPIGISEFFEVIDLKPWTLADFQEYCRETFLYPRLSERLARDLFELAGGNPGLSVAVLDELQSMPDDRFEIVAGELNIRGPATLPLLPRKLADELDREFERVSINLGRAISTVQMRNAVCLLNSLTGFISRGDALELLSHLFEESAWPRRQAFLDCAVESAWINIEGAMSYGPSIVTAKRQWAQKLLPDKSLIHGILFEHLLRKGHWRAVLHFPFVSDQLRQQHLESMIIRGFVELGEGGVPSRGYNYFLTLCEGVSSLPTIARIAILHGRSRAEWSTHGRTSAAPWLKQLSETLSDWQRDAAPGGFAPGKRFLSSSVRSILLQAGAQVALGDAWLQRNDPTEAIDTLRPYLWNTSIWKRALSIRRTGLARQLERHFEHHLVALEITFRARFVEMFRTLEGALRKALPELAWHCRAQFLDALWRIREGADFEEVIRDTTPEPFELGENRVVVESPFLSSLNLEYLVPTTQALYEDRQGQLPAWIGAMRFRNWKVEWQDFVRRFDDDKVHRSSATHLLSKAGASEIRDISAKLMSDLDGTIKDLYASGASEILGEALSDKALAFEELGARSGDDAVYYIEHAVASHRAAADHYLDVGSLSLSAHHILLAVLCEVSTLSNEECALAASRLLEHLELARPNISMDSADQLLLEDLAVVLASISSDAQLERLLANTTVQKRLSSLAYRYRKNRADIDAAKEKPDYDGRAIESLRECLRLIGVELTDNSSIPETLFRRLCPTLDTVQERTSIIIRLAELCFRACQFVDAGEYLGRSLDYVADHHRQIDHTYHFDVPIWIESFRREQTPTAIVEWALDRCLVIWRRNDLDVQDRVAFFRAHFMEIALDLGQAESKSGDQRNKRSVLWECWSRFRETLPAQLCEIDRVDVLLLEAEVTLLERRQLQWSFTEATAMLRALNLDSQRSVLHVTDIIGRLIRLTVKLSADFDDILTGVTALMSRKRYARPILEELASALTVVHHEMSTARTEDAGRRQYLIGLSERLFEVAESAPDVVVSTGVAQQLVRLALLTGRSRSKMLRWIRLMGDAIIRRKDLTGFRSTITFFCMLIGERMGATDSDQADKDQILRASVDLCKRLISEATADDSWVPAEERLSLLFNITEKVIYRDEPGLALVSGLVLFRSSATVESSYVGLVGKAWPLDESGARLQLTLLISNLCNYDADWNFHLTTDSTYVWNVLVSLNYWNNLVEIVLRRNARSFARENDGDALIREKIILRNFDFILKRDGSIWALRMAEHIGRRWGNPEGFEAWQIETVRSLFRFLGAESENAMAENVSLFDLMEWLRSRTANLTVNWEDKLAESVHRTLGSPQVLAVFQNKRLRTMFRRLALSFVETEARKLSRASVNELLETMSRALEGNYEDEYISPEDVPIKSFIRQYWTVLTSTGGPVV